MQRCFLFLLLAGLMFGCSPEAPVRQLETAPFFKLSDYISGEIDRLGTAKTAVTKTVMLNGTTETQELGEMDFGNDLRLFREADINKPAWVDKYTTEAQELSVGHTIVTYLARDSSLTVRRLMVEKDQGVPVRIEIDRKTGSVLSDGHHRLVYEPARGYSVTTDQKNSFGKDVDARVEVRW